MQKTIQYQHGGYVSYEPLAQKIDYFASKNTINRYLVSMEGFKKTVVLKLKPKLEELTYISIAATMANLALLAC